LEEVARRSILWYNSGISSRMERKPKMGRFDSCTTLEEAVYQAIGAASVCWDNVQGAGVFDEQQASSVAKDLLSVIRKWINEVANAEQSTLAMPFETVKAENKRLRDAK
jgi:hypothetical protein